MSKLEEKTLSAVRQFSMLDGAAVIAALSGGADSVALLSFLKNESESQGFTLYAAHLNHMLRGAEADRDESFVRSLCEKLGIELFVRHRKIGEIAEKSGQSTELCGRNERYAFFSELSEKLNAKIATAHTASDNAETVIFNMTRGSGIRGLSGIAPVRGKIIRPLIFVTRAEVEDYCSEMGLDFVTDSTNLTDDYSRNRIRHRVIPALKELNPSFEKTITEQSRLLRDYDSFMELKITEAIAGIKTENGYDSKKLSDMPGALQFGVLRELLLQNGAGCDFKTVALMSEILGGGALDLEGELRAVCKQGTLRIINTADKTEDFSEKELKLRSEFIYNSKKYSVEEIYTNDRDSLDISVLELKPVFRTRRAGDRFTLPNRKVTKSLKKLFNELKIPEENRSKLLLLASGSEVLWIEGVGACEQKRSGHGLKIKISKSGEG